MTDDGWQQNSSLIESLLSGFVEKKDDVDPQYEPMLIANHDGRTMEYAIKDELGRSQNFDMSVAFVSQGALQTLKQNFLDFADTTTIGPAESSRLPSTTLTPRRLSPNY